MKEVFMASGTLYIPETFYLLNEENASVSNYATVIVNYGIKDRYVYLSEDEITAADFDKLDKMCAEINPAFRDSDDIGYPAAKRFNNYKKGLDEYDRYIGNNEPYDIRIELN